MDNRILIVGNPVSGGGRGARLLEGARTRSAAIDALSSACGAGNPEAWPVVRTSLDDTWRTEVEAFVRTRGIRTVLVIGGDGTFKEVASLLYEIRDVGELSLVPVPGGRGNDFARSLYGYTTDKGDFWAWAAGRVAAGKRWTSRSLDLGSAGGKLFLNMASIGYGGRVVENAQERKAIWSKTSAVYQVEGLIAMATGGDSRVDVKVNGESAYTGPFFGAFVGNGTCNGTGLHWTREARFDDGQLDALVFPKPGFIDMVRTLNAVKSTVRPAPPIAMRHELVRGATIDFYFDRPTPIELDGDFAGSALSHGFKCLPKALKTWLISNELLKD